MMSVALGSLAWAGAPLTVTDLYLGPGALVYTEQVSPGGMPPTPVEVTETTREAAELTAPEGHPGRLFEATTQRADGSPPIATRLVVDAAGLWHFATARPEALLSYAPKLVLPATPTVGQTWTGEHGEGPDRNTRSCVVEATPACGRKGVAVACTTVWATRTIWMREHWCRGAGWVGYEAMVLGDDFPTMYHFTTEVRRDGQRLPSAPIQKRPFPKRSDLRAPPPALTPP